MWCVHGCLNKGTMVSDRMETSRKLPEAATSYVGDEDIHQEPGECTCPSMHGQQDCYFLCEPHGRDLVPNNEQIGDPALVVVFGKEGVPVSRVSTMPRQWHSGQGIQEDPVIGRLKVETGSVSAENDDIGEIAQWSCLPLGSIPIWCSM